MLKKLSSVSILVAYSFFLSAVCLAQPQRQTGSSQDDLPNFFGSISGSHIHLSKKRERHDILLPSLILRTMERRRLLFISPVEGGVGVAAV
jgi:hypothetical protein